ncbi:MAG TPA: DUF4118 domain-containing protein [Longilinea sp.]|nr:DUF4118 domain-containing protein [Longilinea sp.]
MKFLRYLLSLGLVALAVLAGWPFRSLIHPVNLVMLFLAVVVASAVFCGRGPAILASFISVFAFDYFFVDPRFSFSVADAEYLITFLGLLVVGLVVSGFASQVREQVLKLQAREAQTEALSALSRDLAVAGDMQTMLQAVVDHTSRSLASQAVVLTSEDNHLVVRLSSPGFTLSESEMETARLVFSSKEAHASAQQKTRFLPLTNPHSVVGVLGVKPVGKRSGFDTSQEKLFESFANLTGLAIERTLLAEQTNRLHMLSETEKLQTTLLNSISHDLRTPLVSIRGVLDSLLEVEQGSEDSPRLDPAARLDMLQNAREETIHLNRLVENLLDMTRLESGALKMHTEPSDIQDIIGSALAAMEESLRPRSVQVEIEPDLPLVEVDFVLVEQVIINLLDNALKYSSAGTPVEVFACRDECGIAVEVFDRGKGIPTDQLESVFSKFYRLKHSELTQGIGLGLSICKGIVEAHGGRIWAENRLGGGTKISFILPLRREKDGS